SAPLACRSRLAGVELVLSLTNWKIARDCVALVRANVGAFVQSDRDAACVATAELHSHGCALPNCVVRLPCAIEPDQSVLLLPTATKAMQECMTRYRLG